MKKVLSGLVALLVLLSIAPLALATAVGQGKGITINTEDYPPNIWMCDQRVVYDDNTEPGRISLGGKELIERINNYAFEGESITWTALVLDKNGIDKIDDVFVTIGSTQGSGNDIEVNCKLDELGPTVDDSCNARIGEEKVISTNFDNWDNIAAMYVCTFTVETPDSMYGEYWVTAEVTDMTGLSATFDENEYWYLNPKISLAIDGDITFDNVRPGTSAYSDTILVGNDADVGSGVMLDMFISGTDFYDSSSSGAKCPTTNKLDLTNIKYYAVNGAYSTAGAYPAPYTGPTADPEGYKGIVYGIGFNNPDPFYDWAEIIPKQNAGTNPYYAANLLAPGAEMALTFKLNMPVPCNGNFDTGSIYFYGEAV